MSSYYLAGLRPARFVAAMLALAVVLGLFGCDQAAPAGTGSVATGSAGNYSAAAPVLGVVVDKNARVIELESGSAAETAGIARGDVLKMVDNVPVTSGVDAMLKYRARSGGGKTLSLVFDREGKEITLQALPTPPEARAGQPTPTPLPPDQYYF